MKDIEIAQKCTMEPIGEVAKRAGLTEDEIDQYGKYKAKISLPLKDHEPTKRKLVLVTAINPTPAGEGKSTVTVGLADAMQLRNKKTMIALREPSLGPVMGMKGGATGGGYSQVVPMEDINLHFTGDMHALTAANNTLAALIDNHIHQGNQLGIDQRRVIWKRVVDINDRALRHVVVGLAQEYDALAGEQHEDESERDVQARSLEGASVRLDRLVLGAEHHILDPLVVQVGELVVSELHGDVGGAVVHQVDKVSPCRHGASPLSACRSPRPRATRPLPPRPSRRASRLRCREGTEARLCRPSWPSSPP